MEGRGSGWEVCLSDWMHAMEQVPVVTRGRGWITCTNNGAYTANILGYFGATRCKDIEEGPTG